VCTRQKEVSESCQFSLQRQFKSSRTLKTGPPSLPFLPDALILHPLAAGARRIMM